MATFPKMQPLLIPSLLVAMLIQSIECKVVFDLGKPLHEQPGALDYWKNQSRMSFTDAEYGQTVDSFRIFRDICADGNLLPTNVYQWRDGRVKNRKNMELCEKDIRKFFQEASIHNVKLPWASFRDFKNGSLKVELTPLGIRNLGLELNTKFVCDIFLGKNSAKQRKQETKCFSYLSDIGHDISWDLPSSAKLGYTRQTSQIIKTKALIHTNPSADALKIICTTDTIVHRYNNGSTRGIEQGLIQQQLVQFSWSNVIFLQKLQFTNDKTPTAVRNLQIRKVEYYGEYHADVTLSWDCPENWFSMPLEYEVSCLCVRYGAIEWDYFLQSALINFPKRIIDKIDWQSECFNECYSNPSNETACDQCVRSTVHSKIKSFREETSPDWWNICNNHCYTDLNITACDLCWNMFHYDQSGGDEHINEHFHRTVNWKETSVKVNIGSSVYAVSLYQMEKMKIMVSEKSFPGVGTVLHSVLFCKARAIASHGLLGKWSELAVIRIDKTAKSGPDLYYEMQMEKPTVSEILKEYFEGITTWQIFGITPAWGKLLKDPTSGIQNFLLSVTNFTTSSEFDRSLSSLKKQRSRSFLAGTTLTQYKNFFETSKLFHVDLLSGHQLHLPVGYTVRPNMGLGLEQLQIEQPTLFYYNSKESCYDWLSHTWYNVVELYGRWVITAMKTLPHSLQNDNETSIVAVFDGKITALVCLVRTSIVLYQQQSSNGSHTYYKLGAVYSTGKITMQQCLSKMLSSELKSQLLTSVSFPLCDVLLILIDEKLMGFASNGCHYKYLVKPGSILWNHLQDATQIACNLNHLVLLMSNGTIQRYHASWDWEKTTSSVASFMKSLSLTAIPIGPLTKTTQLKTALNWELQMNYQNFPSHQVATYPVLNVTNIWLPHSSFLIEQLPVHCYALDVKKPVVSMLNRRTALLKLSAEWNTSDICNSYPKQPLMFHIGIRKLDPEVYQKFYPENPTQDWLQQLLTFPSSSRDAERNSLDQFDNEKLSEPSELGSNNETSCYYCKNILPMCFKLSMAATKWREILYPELSRPDRKRYTDCAFRSTQPSADLTQVLTLENLVPNQYYGIEVLGVPLLSAEVITAMHTKTFAENPGSSKEEDFSDFMLFFKLNRTYFQAKFIPKPLSKAILLGTLIPTILMLVMLGGLIAFLIHIQHFKLKNIHKISMKQLTFEDGICVGTGRFSQVRKAELCQKIRGRNGHLKKPVVAVKCLKSTATDREKRQLIDEAIILSKLQNHKNIVQLVGLCYEDGSWNHPMLILEFMAGGSLLEFLHASNSDHLNQSTLWKVASNVCKGCIVLQAKGIIHRDLAARNILLETNKSENLGAIKIADFGLAKMEKEVYQNPNPDHILPIPWMSPEALLLSRYTTQSDVWSLGVLLWEIFTYGARPFGHCSLGHACPLQTITNDEIHREVTQGKTILDFPTPCTIGYFPTNVEKILQKTWCYAADDRICFKKLEKSIHKAQLFSLWYESLIKRRAEVMVPMLQNEEELDMVLESIPLSERPSFEEVTSSNAYSRSLLPNSMVRKSRHAVEVNIVEEIEMASASVEQCQ